MAAIRAFLQIHEPLTYALGWTIIALLTIAFLRGASRRCDE